MPLMNQQADLYDRLSLRLDQAYALAYVSTAWTDFLEDPLTAEHYLEALHSLIYEATEACKKLEENFWKMRRLLPKDKSAV